MSPLPLLLLGALALLRGATPAAASMTTSVWYHAQVSKNQLNASTISTSYQVLDETLCAILATKNPWCHLFTHQGNTCVLYDVVVDSLADPPNEDTATSCKTRHRNVCIVEGTPHLHADTLEHKCLNTTCRNRTFVPTNPAGVWVGVRANEWLDGRPVDPNEWSPGDPHGRTTAACLRQTPVQVAKEECCGPTAIEINKYGPYIHTR